MNNFFTILKRFPAYKWVLFLTVLSGLLEVFGLALFVPIINLASGNSESPWPIGYLIVMLNTLGIAENLLLLMILVVITLSIAFYISHLQRTLIFESKFKFEHNLRLDLMTSIFNSSWSFFKKQSMGDIVNSLTIQSERAAACLSYQIFTLAFFIQTIVYFSISLVLSYELSFIALFCLSILTYVSNLITFRASELGENSNKSYMSYSSKLNEYISAMKLFKVMAKDGVALSRLSKLSASLSKKYFQEEKNSSYLILYMRIAPIILVSAIIFISFEVLNLSGSIVLVFLFVLMRLIPSITASRTNYNSFKINKPSLDIVDKLTLSAASSSSVDNNLNSNIFSRLESGIDIQNISFRHPGADNAVVKNVSIKIKSNQTIGIVGGSGSGKTTLLDIILGMYQPTSGFVYIDGVDLIKFNVKSWREGIGYVGQDSFLFNETLRQNLSINEDFVLDEDINRAIKLANLEAVVKKLDNGLDTLIEDMGRNLSGGEKQRVSLARAIINRPKILVLDEATSSLDVASEEIIREKIEEMSGDYTIIIVTHRLSTVRNADNIYVMDDGEVVESGTYDELMTKENHFVNLFNLKK